MLFYTNIYNKNTFTYISKKSRQQNQKMFLVKKTINGTLLKSTIFIIIRIAKLHVVVCMKIISLQLEYEIDIHRLI